MRTLEGIDTQHPTHTVHVNVLEDMRTLEGIDTMKSYMYNHAY